METNSANIKVNVVTGIRWRTFKIMTREHLFGKPIQDLTYSTGNTWGTENLSLLEEDMESIILVLNMRAKLAYPSC
jgi:hypothetical protein